MLNWLQIIIILLKNIWNIGGVAHLGERIPCTDKVAGSIPVASTMRVSYKGITLGFQPNDTGSIPVTRSNKLCYIKLK